MAFSGRKMPKVTTNKSVSEEKAIDSYICNLFKMAAKTWLSLNAIFF